MTWKDCNTKAEKFVHIKNVYGLAEGQIGFIKEILNISIALQIMIFIALYAPSLSSLVLWIMPIVIVGYIAFNLWFGTWLDEKKIAHAQQNWGSVRNPVLKTILQNQDIIMEKLRRR